MGISIFEKDAHVLRRKTEFHFGSGFENGSFRIEDVRQDAFPRHVHGAPDQRAQENTPFDRSGNGARLRVRRHVRTVFVPMRARRDRDPFGANREPAWPLRVLRDAGY